MIHARRFIFVSSALALLACPLPAHAQVAQGAPVDRVQKLEEQMKSMDATQKQILQLLQAQAGGPQKPPGTTSAQRTPATPAQQETVQGSKPAPVGNLMPGAILDVWCVPMGADTKTMIASEVPIVRMLDRGPYFSLLSHTTEPSLQSYKGKHLALRWSGLMHVTNAGRQLLILEAKFTKTYGWQKTRLALEIDGSEIAELIVRDIDRESFLSATATLDLEPGYYPFKLTYYPGFQDRIAPDMQGSITIKSRAESDLMPTAFGNGSFFVKKSK